jgi:hypothetical protein
MSHIRRIQQKIQKIYQAIKEPEIDVPIAVQVMEWVSLANDYISAASIIDKHAPPFMLPRLQMTGQAVESALKACLVAAHAGFPKGEGHNIVKLYELASEHGFQLGEPDLAFIVHLAHFYFKDLATSTKFKTRFPACKSERLGGAVPENSTFVAIVRSLQKQAIERNQENPFGRDLA